MESVLQYTKFSTLFFSLSVHPIVLGLSPAKSSKKSICTKNRILQYYKNYLNSLLVLLLQLVYEFLCQCEAQYVGCTTQRLVDRIKLHVPMSIRKKSNTAREQPPHICRNNKSKINCESATGQHLIANPECAKTYTDENFWIVGQATLSFH